MSMEKGRAETDYSGVSLGTTFDLFKNKDLRDYTFSNAVLSLVDFSGSDLSGVDFSGARVVDCDFTGAKLDGAVFKDAYISTSYDPSFGAEVFKGASLRDLNCENATLVTLDWHGQDLGHSNFKDAEFLGVNLDGANVDAASFEGSAMYELDTSLVASGISPKINSLMALQVLAEATSHSTRSVSSWDEAAEVLAVLECVQVVSDADMHGEFTDLCGRATAYATHLWFRDAQRVGPPSALHEDVDITRLNAMMDKTMFGVASLEQEKANFISAVDILVENDFVAPDSPFVAHGVAAAFSTWEARSFGDYEKVIAKAQADTQKMRDENMMAGSASDWYPTWASCIGTPALNAYKVRQNDLMLLNNAVDSMHISQYVMPEWAEMIQAKRASVADALDRWRDQCDNLSAKYVSERPLPKGVEDMEAMTSLEDEASLEMV